MNRRVIAFIFLICFTGYNLAACAQEYKYPDFAYEFLGPDKHENYNRKMFNFDLGFNKYFLRPVHIMWATILPQYVMDRIFGISNNLEYPIRLVSSLVQKDYHNAGNETKRFFINTTVGLAGMYDPAKRFMKIERSRDNMDKALARRNMKPGTYFVAPVIVFTTTRGLLGRLLDMALNPSSYIGTPVLAAIKAGIAINRTSYWQTIINMVESSFADPYEITKKAFGIDGYIKQNNFDRVEVLSQLQAEDTTDTDSNVKPVSNNALQQELTVSAKIVKGKNKKKSLRVYTETEILESKLGLDKVSITPNIHLANYAPQSPVVDSMRTSLFSFPDVNKSMWNELSPWNRCFANRIKSDSVNLAEGRENYTFRYILQKNKNAPLAILYPSTGDGVKASHPVMFAKMFYDAGYSVVIHGNPFQWEYVKSMPADYRPGLPSQDVNMMRESTAKIIAKLEKKYNRKFEHKVIMGTSLAALDVLFMASQESEDNKLGDAQFIAICPPVDLLYSVNVVDQYSREWVNFGDDLKQKVAYASAKAVKMYQSKDDIKFEVNHLPFDEDEAKLFTGFVMHQRLSDVIFAIENAPTNKKSDIYQKIYNMGYDDYITEYIMPERRVFDEEMSHGFGLVAIADYLEKSNNYKIYHTVNDYLITRTQLKQLKQMAGNHLTILDNGAHMGFLYRPEFQEDLARTIEIMKG